MILIVNLGDEQQVRISNEYHRLHVIPDCNIVFIEPRLLGGLFRASEAENETGLSYVNTSPNPIADHIVAQGLEGQINYITALGQTFRMTGLSDGAATAISHSYALTYPDELVGGTTPRHYHEDGKAHSKRARQTKNRRISLLNLPELNRDS
ncbi:MAG: hypothetical protein WC047_00825 [Kiritimatiellales bacterium]